MMLSKCVSVRVLLSPNFLKRFIVCSSSYSTFQSIIPAAATHPVENFGHSDPKLMALSFKEWFRRSSSNEDVLDRIFAILDVKDEYDHDMSCLGLKLSEEFVLKVLNHGKIVYSCVKFFDWAGKQHGYNHTRATFNAIFKILSREKLMDLMLDLLNTYKNQRHLYKVRFYDTLVMGYAVAGKPYIALDLLGKMRFLGLDLDAFAYHVLLNALVEHECYDIVEAISKHITLRGLDNEITACIRVKNLCKQNRLEEAEAFIRGLERDGGAVDDYAVSVLVDSLCKRHKFEEAGLLVKDFQELRKFPLPHTYGIWIRNLVQAAKLDSALKFLRSKRLLEGYLPDVFRYNKLICRLLTESRLPEVYDLLTEMLEGNISPDKVTMNAALCFFCKAGMIDVAVELYKSRSEFGLSLNSMAYNFLINTLCGDGNVDEAYRVLRDSKGYFPGKKTFSILTDALCREGKLDTMMELITTALDQKVVPSDTVCVKFISGLCRAGRVDDGYVILGKLNRYGKVTNMYTYFELIRGFNKSNRGDMASRLLIEMQQNGHTPTRNLYRAVIGSLCTMDDPENQFVTLLKMQLSCHEPIPQVYNFFIDGAGHAKKPDLARQVFDMMIMDDLKPNLSAKILLLQSYLKSDRIADALNFYNDSCKDANPGRKLFNTMIVGLSKANKPDLALELLRKVRDKGLVPSLECYEELVRSFCVVQNYDMVVEVIDDLEKSGRQVSSFIGNILLLHSLTGRKLYQAWTRSAAANGEELSSYCLILGKLVSSFSVRPSVDELENLDEDIEKCFPLDIFTYNMLMRRLAKAQRMDYASELFDKIREKGYQPNRWTYDIIVHGLCKHGRREEARRWIDEMYRKGFDLTDSTKQLV